MIDLKGQFVEFRSLIGVQWQGGNRGTWSSASPLIALSFLKAADVRQRPGSGSDRASQHAHELRLIATDAGDGIGSDMANWVEARLVRDLHSPRFGKITTRLAGQPALTSVVLAASR
ncbi:MAG: hypothetical protein R3C56_30785 [Pirellulaceae bacterium]